MNCKCGRAVRETDLGLVHVEYRVRHPVELEDPKPEPVPLVEVLRRAKSKAVPSIN